MKRRELIKLISGAAAVWPVTPRAQRPKQVRQIGAQFAWYEGRNNDQEVEVLTKSLQALEWTDGQNVHVDYRWAEKELAGC